jgi:hypothetical protein
MIREKRVIVRERKQFNTLRGKSKPMGYTPGTKQKP